MRWNELSLTGWGRNCTAEVLAGRPERPRDAAAALSEAGDGGIVAYGAGRSYGDAALNDGGHVVLTERLDRILAFDQQSGEVVVEPGVTFRDLLEVFLPRGFLVPVSPGTAFATVGGAVAQDVHGKNHDAVGSFGDHVQWLDLLLPTGETQRVSPSRDKEIFEATVGGIGLTGVILAVAFRLLPVPGNVVRRAERRVACLDDLLTAFTEVPRGSRSEMAYSVAWIDGLARGRSLGRGVLETAAPAEASLRPARAKTRRLPVDLPGFLLNGASVRVFNEIYYRRVPATGREALVPYEDFLYPLDSITDWHRLYGKQGFYQFQCVLPPDSAEAGLPRLLEAVSSSRRASFLAVLKTLGGTGRGCLSFPMKGFTLALDFPRRPGVEDLLDRLERLTLDHGGRIYLAKDSRLSAAGFAAMYPRLGEFRETLAKVDPRGRMVSGMARRLCIREAAV